MAEKRHCALSNEYKHRSYELVYCLKTGFICMAFSSKGWQRCRILKLHENSTCNVLLFDIGLCEHVNWDDLRIIAQEFCGYKPLAIRCSLINIRTAQPIERYSVHNSITFNQILKDNRDFYVFANRPNCVSSEIFLYYKLDDQFHCVNRTFPIDSVSEEDSSTEDITSSLQIASTPITESPLSSLSSKLSASNSTERLEQSQRLESFEESPTENHMEQKPDNSEQMTQIGKISKPWNIVVKYVAGIDEIYVCFEQYIEIVNKLRFDVQTFVEVEMPATKTTWQIGDYCLALDPKNGSGEWFRGKIISITTKNICMVFLRDIGQTIQCKVNHLKEINEYLRTVRDFTWKVKLSSIKRTNQCSPHAFVDELRKMIVLYEEMAISAVFDSNKNDWGVILWGIKKTFHALLPENIEYININDELVKCGVATTKTSFHGISDMIKPLQSNINIDEALKSFQETREFINGLQFSHEINGNMVPLSQQKKQLTYPQMDVKNWLPSEKIAQKNFVAFPMYVSKNCHFFVLEASRKTVAEEIEKILLKKYRAKELKPRDSIEWRKEDACFARYGTYFYRATIRRVNFASKYCMASEYLFKL